MDEPTAPSPTRQEIVIEPGQPVVPPPHVRAEIEEMLRNDPSRTGDCFRAIERDEDAEGMKTAVGSKYPGVVWHYERLIKALRDGDLPTAPTVIRSVSRKFRTVLKSDDLSEDARLVLSSNLVVLDRRAADRARQKEETEAALTATAETEAEAIPGIYVYTLPHYLRYPYDDDSGRTLFKVGRSDRDVIERFRSQTRTTALPEEPVLLRVYPVAEDEASAKAEREFHTTLEAADHDRSTARTGGTEWFLTSVRFLDRIAALLDLPIEEVFDVGDID